VYKSEKTLRKLSQVEIETKEAMKQYDTDGSGSLEFQFVAMVCSSSPGSPHHRRIQHQEKEARDAIQFDLASQRLQGSSNHVRDTAMKAQGNAFLNRLSSGFLPLVANYKGEATIDDLSVFALSTGPAPDLKTKMTRVYVYVPPAGAVVPGNVQVLKSPRRNRR